MSTYILGFETETLSTEDITLKRIRVIAHIGTLASSGLGGLKAALAEDNKPSQPKSPSNSVYEHETYSPYDRNYE